MRPETETDLADLVRGAVGPFAIRGGGTRGGHAMGEVLETGGLNGVRLYEPGALTMVALAGTPLADIEARLAEENQRLAFEPGDWRALLGTDGTPTIGGVVAANISGPRRIQTGACRDHMLGVQFVDGTGTQIKNGGRVMKNVTGYDLVKVMTGAWGTLGVLTEVSFKVLAKPQRELTLVGRGLGDEDAVSKLSAALGSPFDITGAAHAQAGVLEDDPMTLVRIEGLDASVRYRKEQLSGDILQGFEAVEDTQSALLWAQVRDVSPFAGDGSVWRVSVKPSDGPRISERLALEGHAHRALMDWGGGLVWLHFPGGTAEQADAIRALCAELGGHATLIRSGSDALNTVPKFQPENPVVAKLSADLRARFDPRGLFNPGLMG